ncbi:MAG: nuclear transport factor 2 family protein [Mycobacteriales bacterium]
MTVPGWQPLIDARDGAIDPRVRHALDLVARHVVAEVAGDMEGVLATLVPQPRYRIWGASSSTGPVGAAEVRGFYENLFGSGKNRLDYVLTRVVADAAAVVTEGEFHHVYDGTALLGLVGDEVHAGHWYHVAYQALVVWPVGPEGLLAGEDIYAGEAPRVLREIAATELPHLGLASRTTTTRV